MKRLVAVALAATSACVLLIGGLGTATSSGAGSTYRVDVLFDTAKGIIPGQLAKIAGAKVGKVVDVKLTDDFKARIQLEVDGRFSPFHTDASCSIQPEGLISENFVQCDPGTADAPPLNGKDGKAPTVPVDRTTVPINLIDLFNVFTSPARQRFSILIATLGIGIAGRGNDVNDILRRANPTLQLVQKASGILNGQRRELADSVVQTDRIIGELARRKDRVREFIDRSASVLTKTANHRGQLEDTVRRLPGLLDAAQPALTQLDRLAVSGTPVLRNLRAAAPDLNRLIRGLQPFAAAALPVITELDRTARVGRRAARDSGPTVKLLRSFAGQSGVTGDLLNELVTNLRDRGGVEGLFNFIYYVTASAARYDTSSHMVPAHVVPSTCSNFATTPVAGCNANWSTGPATGISSVKRSAAVRRRAAAGTPPTTPAASTTPATPGAPTRTGPVEQLTKPITDLLGQVLGPVAGSGTQQNSRNLDDVLSYLLK
jgi:ABC-type transporter Mla subunit MlaD